MGTKHSRIATKLKLRRKPGANTTSADLQEIMELPQTAFEEEFGAALRFNETFHEFPELKASHPKMIEVVAQMTRCTCWSLRYFLDLRRWAKKRGFNERNVSKHFGKEHDPCLGHLVAALDSMKDMETISKDCLKETYEQWDVFCRLQTQQKHIVMKVKEEQKAHRDLLVATVNELVAVRAEWYKRTQGCKGKYFESIDKIDGKLRQEIHGTGPAEDMMEKYYETRKNGTSLGGS